MRTKPSNKKLANISLEAFSLMEMVVTMAIIAIIMVMLSNVLINSIVISQRSIARSFIREEVATVLDLIAIDIRKATTIGACDGSLLAANCDFVIGTAYSWEMCDDPGGSTVKVICKRDAQGNILYSTSPSLQIDTFRFEQGYGLVGSARERNVLVTIVGSHVNTKLSIRNVVSQVAISSRNYYLIAR
ncbi:MAG: prepilin-type N-terminal cleavage/methylation domain-containing protein [Candidatus Doudnabacteria bacterium]|nr:prepilin-type N-terminal cleavage/methylation domain-containing protein [Candidatus Doudnabacteria bacterium]